MSLAVAVIHSHKGFVVIVRINYGTQIFREAVLCYHCFCKLGGTFQIAYRARGAFAQNQFFSYSSAHADDDFFFKLSRGNVQQRGLLFGKMYSHASRRASGDNCYLVHLILSGHIVGYYRVTRLVVRNKLFLLLGDNMAFLFGARYYLDSSLFDVFFCNGLAVLARRQQSRFVCKVFKLCACKAGCGL